jgi:predicted transcriptional regulator
MHMPKNLSYTACMNTAPATTTSVALSSTESRALELLAAGIEQVQVASALGITESRLSQIVSNPDFATALTEARYKQLAKHNETDNLYDKIERKLAEKLVESSAMLFKPTEIARTLSLVNGLKRRGASNPDSLIRARPTLKLNIPIAVVNHFQMNAAGQVVTASTGQQSQDLVTMQSGKLKGLLNEHAKLMGAEHASTVNARLIEADGVRYVKPQGRESVDLLAECGFTEELIAVNPGAGESHNSPSN